LKATVAESASFTYRAFVSYSHRDKVWGEWLHSALEDYRIDKNLVGRETAVGPVPATLRPVFRDREDFAAGHSLTEQTLAALAASKFLVVVCSLHAAQSKYVNEEILHFKAMAGGERVIAIIVDGEPGDPARECLPAALRFKVGPDGALTGEPEEPIAADARRQGDGKRRALQKVIAGLLGVPFDDVRKREAIADSRRIKIAAACVLVVAVLALFAVYLFVEHQRQLALEVERNEAAQKRYQEQQELGVQLQEKQERLLSVVREQAASVARDKGVDVAQLRAILAKMSLTDVRQEDILKLLDEKADELIKLRAERDRVGGVFGLRAQMQMDKGDLDQAKLTLDAGRDQIRAVQLIDAGRSQEALTVLEGIERRLGSASMEASTDVQLVRGYVYKTYAQAFSALADDRNADQYLNRALKEFEPIKDNASFKAEHPSEFASAINGIGNVLAARGKFRDAVAYYQLATSLDPKNAYAWHDMFLAYYQLAKQGDIDVPAMRQALDKTRQTGRGWPGLKEDIAKMEKMAAEFERSPRPRAKPPGTRRP
jgi:tetratricopeptide (TPR) repeat protein